MSEPLHRRIAADLRHQITSKALAEGERLPTELELRAQYGASRNTIRDAIQLLKVQGLVDTRAGSGTYVTQRIEPFVITLTKDPDTGLSGGDGAAYRNEIQAQGRRPTESSPRVEIQQARDEVAEALGVAPGTTVVVRHQERYIDDIPWSLQSSYYSMDLVTRGASQLVQPAPLPEGTTAYLRTVLQIEQAGYRDLVRFRPAGDSERQFFRLSTPPGLGVLDARQVTYDQTGAPVRFTVSVFPADRVELAVVEGSVPSLAS